MDPLPATLIYLQPVLRELAALPDDELNESVDTTTLEAALRERIAGLSRTEADARLEEDRRALSDWLAERQEHPKALPHHFVYGWMLDVGARELLAPPQSASREPRVVLDGVSPEGLAITSEAGRLDVDYDGVEGAIEPLGLLNWWWDRRTLSREGRGQSDRVPAQRVSRPIQFGQVKGMKFDYVQEPPMYWREINYFLRVPGGRVHASVSAMDKPFDEGPFESVLHAVRVVRGGR